MLIDRFIPALTALMLLLPGPGHAAGERLVLLEDPGLPNNRLHYPVLISNERGYRIQCRDQQSEEAIIRGLGFAVSPSQILDPVHPDVVAANPLSNPLLCPSAPDYEIKVFGHDRGDGLTYYLQFPADFNSETYTDRIYVPGCTGLVEALAVDLAQAMNADPTPFFQGKIHQIDCLIGEPPRPKPQTFADWCTKGDRSEAETATVMALLDAAPGGVSALGDAEGCASANEFLGLVTAMNLNGKGVQSLAPLSVLPHLTSLSLANNQIVDLSPLTKLRALNFLNLSGNQIVNLSALAPLTSLTNLNLSANSVSDIRFLSTLVTLSRLNLNDNNVGNLEPLQFLQALSDLSLARNGLTGDMLEPLTALGVLFRLDLSGNNIASFEHLGEFASTLEIDLSANPIVVGGGGSFLDLCILHRDAATPFGHTVRALLALNGSSTCRAANNALMGLLLLDLSGKSISNLQPLMTLTHLTNLNLSSNVITDVGPLSGLNSLVALNLDDNNISDIRPVGPLANLTTFTASGNPVSVADYLSACLMRGHDGLLSEPQAAEVDALYDISGAETCQQSHEALRQLQSANLRNRGLKTLSYFPVMENLWALDISDNLLTDVSPLSPIASLRHLRVNNNQIASMAALVALRRLEVLAVNGNPLQSLNGISNLNKLKELYFSNTEVSSVLPLASLPELENAAMRNLSIVYQSFKAYCLVHKFDSVALGFDRSFMLALDSRIEAANVDRADCDAVDAWAQGLEALHLNKKSITSVRPIRHFNALRELHLFDNRIADARPIATLTELRKLNLARNRLTTVPAFASSGLQALYLSENNVSTLNSLSHLSALAKLVMTNNRIESPTPVAGIGPLKYVDLRDNRIATLGAVVPLLAKNPYLKGNPVCQLMAHAPGFPQACTRDPSLVIGTVIDVMDTMVTVRGNTALRPCATGSVLCPEIRLHPFIPIQPVNP